MSRICYVLLSDGSSDKRLMPILNWLLTRRCPNRTIEPEWADLRRLPRPPRTLSEKIRKALEIYEPDLLFIHRDAEKQPFEKRKMEIDESLSGLTDPPAVCIVPIRMSEAWLLFDERAIRRAAGNPNGRMPLQLPNINTVESIPDPKERLFSLIREASGLSGTRLKKLKTQPLANLVSRSISDFESLQHLSSFRALESELSEVIRRNAWDTPQDWNV